MKDQHGIASASSKYTEPLRGLVAIANRASRAFNDGYRSTCISTSYALDAVLRRIGLNSYPLRVEAAVFPNNTLDGAILGAGRRFGGRAGPGMWNGHLVVAIERAWLLDPTLDQANKKEWPRSARVGPSAVGLTDQFWKGLPIFISMNDSQIRYTQVKQQGFANAPDARPSHWKPLADLIMETVLSSNLDKSLRGEAG